MRASIALYHGGCGTGRRPGTCVTDVCDAGWMNLVLCADSVAYLKKHGREVILTQTFFDGCKTAPDYAMKVLEAAAEAGTTFT